MLPVSLLSVMNVNSWVVTAHLNSHCDDGTHTYIRARVYVLAINSMSRMIEFSYFVINRNIGDRRMFLSTVVRRSYYWYDLTETRIHTHFLFSMTRYDYLSLTSTSLSISIKHTFVLKPSQWCLTMLLSICLSTLWR
jgi:hypothetical protein